MKVFIDPNKCSGHGRCYEIAIDVFECGEDGKGLVKVAEIPDDDVDAKLQASSAEMMCPAAAITTEGG